MESKADMPIVEIIPLSTAFPHNSETTISGTAAEQILNIPVAPSQSNAVLIAPKEASVTARKEDIAQGIAVVPTKVHVAIADDLKNEKSEQKADDSLMNGVAAVDPVLLEIQMDTSAAKPSAASPVMMNASNEGGFGEEHSPIAPPAAETNNNLAPVASDFAASHDSSKAPSDTHSVADDQKELSVPTSSERIRHGERLTSPLPDVAPGPGFDDSLAETDGISTAPIPSVTEQSLILPPESESLRQASSSTVQTDELNAYEGPDPFMVQEAVLLDIEDDPQKTLMTSEEKSPLIGEIDYCEIMEHQHNDETSLPVERRNSNDDLMVREAALLDVQDNPPYCHTPKKASRGFEDDVSESNNNLTSEGRNEPIAEQRTDSFHADTPLKSSGEGDKKILSVDDEDSSGDSMIEEINMPRIGPAASRKRPRFDQDPSSKPSGNIVPQNAITHHGGLSIGSARLPVPVASRQPPHSISLNSPVYLEFHNFTPTWNDLLPTPQKPIKNERRLFRLSLLNVNEFTIIGLPIQFGRNPTPIAGLRASIKAISREHGKAVYERDPDGSGKWRIPLGAYHAFASFLQSDPLTTVEGIPQHQLQVASMERARQAQGYPTSEQLEEKGVPSRLAVALAPFQRGGVDFVFSKNGRALIADDMGLGKTIQAIASMSLYIQEWPLLVLCPSSARYHWESEFLQWLGEGTLANNCNPHDEGSLISPSQINVLSSSKDEILTSKSTKVVICSYGLVTALVESGKICPGMFCCAIVDESHMLKNKSSKRTSRLVPVLTATKRCVLLSGTPALARPAELWPQLLILGTERYGWWDDEAAFVDKYARNGNAERSAELHTMLTGTVMIRRLKSDILKSLPRKLREKASFDILGPEQRVEFKDLLAKLREGKGTLGQLARIEHHASSNNGQIAAYDDHAIGRSLNTGRLQEDMQDAIKTLEAEVQRNEVEGRIRIQNSLHQASHRLSKDRYDLLEIQLESEHTSHIESQFRQGMDAIKSRFVQPQNDANHHESKRTRVLARLYERTGQVKIPLIVDLLKRWLNDPAKGKLCIFAHHLSVLDAIRDLAELSNQDPNGKNKYIRIDGSTNPKFRQEQIKIFQSDPTTRVALLGITAAGVAVTLTASSTVWFAELFWTPAIMIQAEDRCHRIGQQARVRCLYFVARGTIDDILWRLIEKKFTDLGEFVEGKENHKLVVDKTYHTVKELHDQFQGLDFDENEDTLNDVDMGDDILQLDSDLVHDIEMLGDEEQRMLQVSADDDEAPDPESTFRDSADFSSVKVAPLKIDNVESAPAAPQSGQTEDDPIALSDEEEDTKKVASTEPENGITLPTTFDSRFNFCGETSRAYRIILKGPSLGLTVDNYKGRIVVSKVKTESEFSKPSVGDIFASVNGVRFPIAADSGGLLRFMRTQLQHGATEFIFVEEPTFVNHFKGLVSARELAEAPILPAHSVQKMATASGEVVDVIEIE